MSVEAATRPAMLRRSVQRYAPAPRSVGAPDGGDRGGTDGRDGDGRAVIEAPRTVTVDPPAAAREAVAPAGRTPWGFAIGVAGLAVLSVVVPLGIARRAGALGVPRGDDWSYLRTLLTWVDGGGLHFNNWVSMTLVGQLVLAAPVALATDRSITALQVLVAIIGFAGLGGVVVMARAVTRRRSVALLVAYTVALGPLWAGLATTFMTDVPGVAFSALSAAVGLQALRGELIDRRRLVASVALGFVAFTIREYAALPAVAIVVVAVLSARPRGDRQAQRTAVLSATIAVALGVVLLAYWRTVPGGKPFTPAWPSGHSLRAVVYKGTGMARLAGLWLVPLLLYARPHRVVRRAWRASRDLTVWTVLLGAVGLAFTGFGAPRIAFAGNYVVPDGFLGNGVSAGYRSDLIPNRLFSVLMLVGSLGVLMLALMLVPVAVRLAAREPAVGDRRVQALGLTTTLYVAVYGVASVLGLPLYDRYVVPIIVFSAVLVAHGAVVQRDAPDAPGALRVVRPAPVASALLALVALAALSLVYAADSASFDAARWRVSQAAVRAGWRPVDVGGNFEWVNWYSDRPGTFVRNRGRFCVKVVVDARRRRAAQEIAWAWYRPPFHDPVRVRAIRTDRPGCAAARP